MEGEAESAPDAAADAGSIAENAAENGVVAAIEIRCPSCRKVAPTPLPPRADFACPRCRCDLAVLAEIRLAANVLQRAARTDLLRGDYAHALDHASDAWELCHSGTAASIAFIAATLHGDPLEGAAWLRSARVLSAG